MFLKLMVVAGLLLATYGSAEEIGFIFEGFQSRDLAFDEAANITADGLLELTNISTGNQMGHAFYPNPLTFKNSSNGTASSFSTTFVFAMVPKDGNPNGGQGMAFVIAPQRGLPWALPAEHLGLFNANNEGKDTNHVFFVELDTIENPMYGDIDDNHVGINFNGLVSNRSLPAGYHPDSDPVNNKTMNLTSSERMQLWVDYDGIAELINVTLAPFNVEKPHTPLMSLKFDLSPILKETMYVGFSAATGTNPTFHYVVGWSFKMNGQAQALSLRKLPKPHRWNHRTNPVSIGVAIPSSFCFILVAIIVSVYFVEMKRKFAEVLEDWELVYGPHRFKYKDLYIATKGFSEQELLGAGGFGRVYRGVLPSSNTEVAVKKVSHESGQGMQEFVAEIISIGRLRHRNLVPLHGYCRRKGELLLVYDYMPNSSLDNFLYDQSTGRRGTLNWSQRMRIIKGVTSGLLYLHEEWEQVVIHRDIKASNVLLDAQLNGRLGDFGLARLYDHGTDPRTTILMGTPGYLAPELTRTGRASKASDVFAFGAFLLEVATGRRPFQGTESELLVDWVFSYWTNGEILGTRDPNLGDDFVAEEVELVLKLGLVCSQFEPGARPNLRQVKQYLEGDAPVPELLSLGNPPRGLVIGFGETADDCPLLDQSFVDTAYWSSSSTPKSQLSRER